MDLPANNHRRHHDHNDNDDNDNDHHDVNKRTTGCLVSVQQLPSHCGRCGRVLSRATLVCQGLDGSLVQCGPAAATIVQQNLQS